MLEKSDRAITEVIQAFAKFGAEAAYIVPTITGMKKAIMDAHAGLREFLERRNIHNYKQQPQGSSHKVLLNGWLLLERNKIPIQISLYRPKTKGGDPRIWIYGLQEFAKPHNLLAIIENKSELYVINTSNRITFEDVINLEGSPLNSLLTSSLPSQNPIESELLCKIKDISRRGFIKSLRQGPTGIGMTLESLLGIQANSKKAPDYKGIEIKASRYKNESPNCRVSLFGRVPDWKNSNLKNASALLNKFGYPDKKTGRPRLTCTIGIKPNPQGLYFRINEKEDLLEICYKENMKTVSAICWKLEDIRTAMKEKHRHTFWVKANTREIDGDEEFDYYEILETKEPLIDNLVPLFELGVITLDFTISTKLNKSGNPFTRDHSYLFKMKHRDFDLLFPPSKIHILK